MGKEDQRKSCFIVTPIGAEGSETRRKTDGLLEVVLRPTLEEAGYDCIAAHEIAAPGSITRDVIIRLVNCELVVANLTGLNPNVMYELAIRHCVNKSVISIAEEQTELPFDVTDQRVIRYHGDLAGVEPLRKDLKQALSELESDGGNPVSLAVDMDRVRILIGDAGAESKFEEFVLDELKEIRDVLNRKPPNSNLRSERINPKFFLRFPHLESKEFQEFFDHLWSDPRITPIRAWHNGAEFESSLDGSEILMIASRGFHSATGENPSKQLVLTEET